MKRSLCTLFFLSDLCVKKIKAQLSNLKKLLPGFRICSADLEHSGDIKT